MEVSPGYKQTEVGNIPEEWGVSAFESVARIIDPQPDHRTPPEAFGGDPYIGISDFLDDRSVNWDACRKVMPKAADKQRRSFQIRFGDILFGKIGTIGSPKFAPVTPFRYALSANVLLIQPRIEPHFVMSWLQSSTCQSAINGELHSTSQAAFGINKMRRVKIPLPPEPEQRAIAEAFGDADALLDGLGRLIAKKRDLKQAAMQHLLTGQTRLPGFHDEWEAVELGDIASIRNTKVVASSTPAGTQCVELESISQGSGRLLASTDATGASPKYSFRKGDVLFGRLRAYLRKYWLATFDGVCSTEIWPLVARDGRLGGGFLYLLVQTNGFMNAAGVSYGTHMPRSDWSVLQKLPIRLPPHPEQTAITGVLSDMDAELSALLAQRDKTRDLKQALMQELLTGKTRLVSTGVAHA
jgi:type I restriction enzyme S subunit